MPDSRAHKAMAARCRHILFDGRPIFSTMPTHTTTALSTFDDLVHYVRATLCSRDELDYERTPFVKTPLTRRDEFWGYAFHVEGPRMLRTSAVWSAKDDKILFYDSCGQRVQDVTLTERPALTTVPAGPGDGA